MIRFSCGCGHVLELSDLMAGRSGVCTECTAPLVVPQRSTLPEAMPALQAASSSAVRPFHLPITGLCGIALVVAFFLPWMRLSCAGVRISEPTGLDLAVDRMDSTMKHLAEASSNGTGKLAGVPIPESKKTLSPDESPWGGATPELFLFPALGLVLVGFALLALIDPGADLRPGTRKVLVLALAGICGLIVEKQIDYRKAHLSDLQHEVASAQGQSDEVKALAREMFTPEAAAGFYLALASLSLVVLAGGSWLSLQPSSA